MPQFNEAYVNSTITVLTPKNQVYESLLSSIVTYNSFSIYSNAFKITQSSHMYVTLCIHCMVVDVVGFIVVFSLRFGVYNSFKVEVTAT